jgi:hypothetical protein
MRRSLLFFLRFALLAATGCGPGPYLLTLLGASGGSTGHGDAPPTLSASTPAAAQVGGRAEIGFVVSDAEGDPVQVSFEYAIEGGPFRRATPVAGTPTAADVEPVAANPARLASADGRSYAFLWDCGADLAENSADVRVAILPATAAGSSAR